MKNYLFAPFKDDDEKIEEFNAIKNYLPKKFRHELIMFMGSLESYYDKIISDLSNKCAVAVADERIIKGLEDKVRELKADNKRLNDDYNNDTKVHNEYADGLLAEIKELKEGLSNEGVLMLQDDNKKLQSIIDELRESNKKLSKSSDVAYMEILNRSNDKLKADNVRLVEQVSSISGNSSSTHTHTNKCYTKETEIDAEMVDMHGNVKTIKCYTKDM